MPDYLIVNRDNTNYQLSLDDMSNLRDTDLLLVNRDGTTYTMPGSQVNAGTGNTLNPSLPPFGGLTTSETQLASADSKVEFSLDGLTYSNTLTVPIDTFYYVDWGTDILSAAQDSNYQAEITATYADLGISNTISFEIKKIDKLPDPFDFTDTTENFPDSLLTSDVKSPLQTINAPATIWVTSDAPLFELRIGNGNWFNPPSVPNTAYVSPNEELQVRHKTGLGSDTTYTTDVNVGYGSGAGEFVTATFATTTQAIAVADPVLSGGGTDVSVQPTFTTSAYSEVGGAGVHASTDWQIATDSAFTNIVTQNLSDTTNKTSWTPYVSNSSFSAAGNALGRLDGGTQYYVRARYRSSLGYESNYALATLTTEALTLDFSIGGTNTVTIPGEDESYIEYTIPAGVGRIRAAIHGTSHNVSGGLVVGTINVAPGEVLRVQNVAGTVALLEEQALSTTTVIGIAGEAGVNSSGSNQGPGGQGGGTTGGTGGTVGPQNSPGTGGSQSSGGTGGTGPSWIDNNEGNFMYPGEPGEQFKGGAGGASKYADQTGYGGKGGSGWYGGGGGGGAASNDTGGSGGGGGSSRWIAATSWRQGSQEQNSSGASSANAGYVVFTY